MHTLGMLLQLAGEAANKLTLEHVSTALLIAQQIQLSQMKVKINAVWAKFLGDKAEKDEDDI